jgi:hypothetical protein
MNNILFLDIETVAEKPSYDYLDDRWKALWQKKSGVDSNLWSASYKAKAALYPEFAKIVCVSVGKLVPDGSFVTESFASYDELEILTLFRMLLEEEKFQILCAHNGKAFDFPFIAKRLTKYGQKVPRILSQAGKKPWEITNIDTMEMWNMGVFGSKTSLDTLCAFFNIPSPKDEIDGGDVHGLYYGDDPFSNIKIATYCEKDVKALYEVYKRINSKL